MADQKSFVEKVRKDIDSARKERLWTDAINMLSTVSESIFSRSAHFILELLQNAEDAGVRIGTDAGEIEFRISPERIKVSHNGAVFSQSDVDAICGVRSSKKPEQGTLGFLGIGFKSVFKVTDCPQIHSGGFHFKFDKSEYPDPEGEPWQIMPIWLDEPGEELGDKLTCFVLPFRSPQVYGETRDELRKLDVHIFMFLRWLKSLRLIDEVSGQMTSIENLGEQDGVISLKKDGIVHRFAIFRRQSLTPTEVREDPALEFYKRQNVRQREVVLAFGVDEDGNLMPINEASALGSVSSFLPLVEERSGAKFLIQSDFLVQPGREAIQYELSWNHWLVEEAAEAAKHAIEQFKQHPKWGSQFLPLFNFSRNSGQAAFDRLFGPKLQDPLTTYLTTAEVYPTVSGQHVEPEYAVVPHDSLKDLVTDSDLPFLFGGRTDLHLAATELDHRTVPWSIQNKTATLDLGKVARNEELLRWKLSQKGYSWFAQLYTAMCESGSVFERTAMGKSYFEDPIFVLTDNDTIARATDVYLREVPATVLQLRKRFPEVGTLLDSYKLIHPKLQTSQLITFFTDKTHVRSIDFERICRDVFHPKVRLDAPVPAKDELVAYTRLLQQGPSLNGGILVVTKNGTIKPSNQVFFGSDYSPAEDWERQSQYLPQMDFLSAEYLQNGGLSDWKQFFMMVGVRERAEDHHVEEFATAFVESQLGSQLTNFIRKDRQQQGYDREAQRIADGSTVYLEIKGQRTERQVKLDGNEPKTAKQANQQGLGYWLCIVPGVPNSPELWLVEDVEAAGDYDTLTIDVTKWKMFGKRLV